MNFVDSVRSGLVRWKDFRGRSSRSEFWWFVLFHLAIAQVANMVAGVPWLGDLLGVMGALFFIALILPLAAAATRRLRDTDVPPLLCLLFLVPIVGPILLIVILVLPGTPGWNRYGPPPDETAQQVNDATAS